jgi:hypothetical protein
MKNDINDIEFETWKSFISNNNPDITHCLEWKFYDGSKFTSLNDVVKAIYQKTN